MVRLTRTNGICEKPTVMQTFKSKRCIVAALCRDSSSIGYVVHSSTVVYLTNLEAL